MVHLCYGFWVCDFFPFDFFLVCNLWVCDFLLCSFVCGCGVVLMVAFWEVGGGCGRVSTEMREKKKSEMRESKIK